MTDSREVTVVRPNVVLVLADDLGYSDLGCYGSEIRTANLDELGRRGVRLSQFYNTARCSPSRASLLTGLHPHQTGIGVLTNDDSPDGYPGTLGDRCVTTAEVLRAAGYATCLAGKWHMSSQMRRPDDSWPTRRGFDRFFGTITGCGSYYQPGTLTRGEKDATTESDDPDFFYTDAISAEAEEFIREATQPFFLYAAYTAPHWPLHAPEADVDAYDGVYDAGWDELRRRRMDALIREGILPPDSELSDRDPTQPAWDEVSEKTWQARRMQVYAAMVERMDRGIGRIVTALRETGRLDDTLFIFLSDNGASPETLPKATAEQFRTRVDILPRGTRDGRPIRLGNTPDIDPGPEDTYASYGRAWANLSNTPFRYYKRWVHEGGIAAPFIIHWPADGVAGGTVVNTPFQLVDVLPTILDATGVEYPSSYGGRDVPPPEGRTMLPALRGESVGDATLYWEHTGNAALRSDHWKLVREYPYDWELYDIERDRSELHDVSALHPDVVEELSARWRRWADRVGVKPWETTLEIYRSRGLTDDDAAG
jgi:arylsulfatase A-like enzyme